MPYSPGVLSSSLSAGACTKKDEAALEAVRPLVGGKGEKHQDQEQEKEEYGKMELESESISRSILSSRLDSEGYSSDSPSESSPSSSSCPTTRREGGLSDAGFREYGGAARGETGGST